MRRQPRLIALASALVIVLVITGLAGAQVGGLLPLPPLDLLPGLPTAPIDPLLQDLLNTARPDERVEAVVTFDRLPTATDLAAVAATGVETLRFRALPMVGVRGTTTQIRGLFALPGVRSIYSNRRLPYFLDESVPLVGAERVWNELGYTGRGVTIAVIDTGIDASHPDLPFGEKVVQNVKIAPDLFGGGPLVIEGLFNTDTTSGHGTHVASTAAGSGAALAGKYRGIAPGASLVGIGAGDLLFVLAALEGFDWVLANREKYGIRVISNSWGTEGSFSPDDPINVASKMAHEAGLVVLFAAGNAGPDSNTLSPYCVARWAICVAAGHKDGRTLADFSSRGLSGDPFSRPTITAPGVNIAAARATTGIVINTFFAVDLISLGTDAVWYAAASGTSMATPHVSGAVALMLEADPRLTPDLVKAILEETATPMPGYGEHEVGAGYLNAFEAVRAARSSPPEPTPTRFEESAATLVPAEAWSERTSAGTGVTLSGDRAMVASASGATATFAFAGTGVSWIGIPCEVCGIARVFLDDTPVATVDTFAPTRPAASTSVFSASGLPAGSHTLVIEVTGTRSESSGDTFIAVDAFDVAP